MNKTDILRDMINNNVGMINVHEDRLRELEDLLKSFSKRIEELARTMSDHKHKFVVEENINYAVCKICGVRVYIG